MMTLAFSVKPMPFWGLDEILLFYVFRWQGEAAEICSWWAYVVPSAALGRSSRCDQHQASLPGL
jgi:hypothetical protein